MKIAKLKITAIDPNLFNNRRSYEAAIYAVSLVNCIIERVNAGDIVFAYENIVKPDFHLGFNEQKEFIGLYLREEEGASVQIVGDCTDDNGIHCTKRDIREYFKLWRVAKITNLSKVSDLTK